MIEPDVLIASRGALDAVECSTFIRSSFGHRYYLCSNGVALTFLREGEEDLKSGRFRNLREGIDPELRYDYSFGDLSFGDFDGILEALDEMDCPWSFGVVRNTNSRRRNSYRYTLCLPTDLAAVEVKLRMP